MESTSRLSESKPQNLAPNINTAMMPVSSSSKTPAVDVPSQPVKKRVRKTTKCQPTAAQLATLGIKVRDFAFEDTGLPPVRTIYRHPMQIQPSVNRPRVLQRELTEPADESVFSQPSQESNCPLERTITEPVLTPPPPARQPGFLNLEDLRTDQRIGPSQPATSRPAIVLSPIAFPPLESLDSSDIKTPIVTPNGSLVWHSQENEVTLTTLPGSQRRTSPQQSVSADMPQMNTIATLSLPLLSTSSFLQPLSRSTRSQTSSALLHKHSSFLLGSKVSHSKKPQDKVATLGHYYNLRKRKSHHAPDFAKQDSKKRIKYTPDPSPSRARASTTSSRLSRSPIQHKRIQPN